MPRDYTRALVFLAVLMAIASPCLAQRDFGIQGAGVRAGVSIDPDQIHFGGHLDLGDLAPRLMVLPNVEIGVGDDITVIATAFEVDYRFRQDWGSWNPYIGGGLGPVFVSAHHHSDTEMGLTFQVGISRRMTSRSGFSFLECKLGLVDAPDFKITIGWTFGS